MPAGHTHGGVVAKGGIERQVTVNLVALRRLGGENAEAMRRYVLGLSLVAATAPLDPFLRQGCLIVVDPDSSAEWTLVTRNGDRTAVDLSEEPVRGYAEAAAKAFGVALNRRLSFSKDRAREDAKKDKKTKAA